jgi:hypothetical protein
MIGWIQFPIRAVLYDSGGTTWPNATSGAFTLWASVSIQASCSMWILSISGTLFSCIIKQRAYIPLDLESVQGRMGRFRVLV